MYSYLLYLQLLEMGRKQCFSFLIHSHHNTQHRISPLAIKLCLGTSTQHKTDSAMTTTGCPIILVDCLIPQDCPPLQMPVANPKL